MILPNAENAFIDDRKLIDCCLSESHPVGKHKARVFISALGFSVENYQDLKNAILINIQNNEAIITEISPPIMWLLSKKYNEAQDKLPMVQKKRRNCFLFPL